MQISGEKDWLNKYNWFKKKKKRSKLTLLITLKTFVWMCLQTIYFLKMQTEHHAINLIILNELKASWLIIIWKTSFFKS